MQDVVIVGAGLTGSWAAKRLSEAGLSVVILEAGPEIAPQAMDVSRWTAAQRRQAALRQPVQSRHPSYWTSNPELFVDDIAQPYRTVNGPFHWIRGRQVGGRGLTWGGVTLRMSDYELRAPEADGFGASWPFRAADLEHSYRAIERYWGIAGRQESAPTLPDGIFVDPPAFTASELHFKRSVEARWPECRVTSPRAIAEPDCKKTHLWPRKTPQHRILPDALSTGRTRVIPDSIVYEIRASRDRAIGVSCIHRTSKQRWQIDGRVVLSCASTLESVRLLLNSRSEQHPEGIGNSSGLLGRYLIDHAMTWGLGTTGQGYRGDAPSFGGPHGVLIPRFRNVDANMSGFVRGYGVWGAAGRASWPASNDEQWLLCAMLEVLPRAENRVRLSPTRDTWGNPIPAIEFSWCDNDRAMLADARSRIVDMAESAGWKTRLIGDKEPGEFVHELGGARMGTHQLTSVLDPYNRCWDVGNLFVLDGACFVTAGWQNPTLTMLAIADRACTFIEREMSAGHL